jgi:hypothetical protein
MMKESALSNPQKTNGRYGREAVERLLSDYHSSALTQKAWCERTGIKVPTLNYWLQREKEQQQGYSLIAVESEPALKSRQRMQVAINGVELAIESGAGGIALITQLIRELGR